MEEGITRQLESQFPPSLRTISLTSDENWNTQKTISALFTVVKKVALPIAIFFYHLDIQSWIWSIQIMNSYFFISDWWCTVKVNESNLLENIYCNMLSRLDVWLIVCVYVPELFWHNFGILVCIFQVSASWSSTVYPDEKHCCLLQVHHVSTPGRKYIIVGYKWIMFARLDEKTTTLLSFTRETCLQVWILLGECREIQTAWNRIIL